jgi:hypothetical protein
LLEGRTYVPLVYLRPAEIIALEELPTVTKNLIFPVIRLRPWLSSKPLSKASDRILKALGDRRFGLDLDRLRIGHKSNETYEEFSRLFDKKNDFENYYSFVDSIPSAVPVLRSEAASEIGGEVQRAISLDRGLIIRIDVGNPTNVQLIAETCTSEKLENVVFVVDCGWQPALLVYQAKCVEIIKSIMKVTGDFELVVAGGDFPQSGFDDKGTHFLIPGEERSLVETVRKQINEAEIVFGDWASTRRPTLESEIRRGRPRIDMPTRTGWECWRKAAAGKTYQEMATAAVAGRKLGTESDLWGEQLIIATGQGVDPSIKSPNTAVAVRVNLHMIMQAHFDDGGRPDITDELVEGEL